MKTIRQILLEYETDKDNYWDRSPVNIDVSKLLGKPKPSEQKLKEINKEKAKLKRYYKQLYTGHLIPKQVRTLKQKFNDTYSYLKKLGLTDKDIQDYLNK